MMNSSIQQVPSSKQQPNSASNNIRSTVPSTPPPSNNHQPMSNNLVELAGGQEEELPQVNAQMIPLSVVVGRLITYAYTELITLVDTLPSRSEPDRRGEILKYIEHVSELLAQLLVLVRWARHAPQIQKCQNVIAYLDSQNKYFEYSVDSIYAAYLSMPNVRMRNYDVGNALDILSFGTYKNLPRAIGRQVPPPKLTAEQVKETLDAIDDIIRGRILCGEPIPQAMRQYRVGGGKVVFRVPKEFEATLTLLQYEKGIPWHVVGVKVLVADTEGKEPSVSVNTRQIIDRVQHLLIEAANSNNKSQELPQLACLYDFMHRQCLAVLLETVYQQAMGLRRTGWENLLQTEAAADRSMVALKYWNGQNNTVMFRVVNMPVPLPLHVPGDGEEEEEEEAFKQIEKDRRDLIPKVGLTITWTAQTGLAEPVQWSRTVAQHSELLEASDAEGLVMDAEDLNAERLLRQVAWRHARAILRSLSQSEVTSQLEYQTVSGEVKQEDELTPEDMAQATATPCLRAWYRQGEGAVDITVDMYTGRLQVRAAETVLSLTETMVGQLADQLNRSPGRLAELLVDLRSSMVLADLDNLAIKSLGLRPQNSQVLKSPRLPGFAASGTSYQTPAGFPVRVPQHEADALVRDVVAGTATEQPLSRIRFYRIEGIESVEEQLGSGRGERSGEWYIMAAMTDRLRFRMVLLNPHPADKLMYTVGQVITLQVDRLFSSVARRMLAERKLHAAAAEDTGNERVDAMLAGRTSITLEYLNALVTSCRARLALRLLQTQLTRWKIPYSFRIPSFSTSPHGHRAAVSQELSAVGLDRMGLYELDEQVPILYIPIAGLMRASPINWEVANQGVLPDEARRLVSIRIAADELDPSPRADLSSSTRVDQHRQAALASVSGTAAAHQQQTKGQSLIGRHVIPCQVIASIPLALDGLPLPMAQAYADAVHSGRHAAADGGYHQSDRQHRDTSGNQYSKVVFVYKQVRRALQCLIRDWSEHHLMTHVGRHLCQWEQRAMRRAMATTAAFYPFSAGPYTAAVASMLGSWRGHQSMELVVQCMGSCFLSVSCRVPYPFSQEDTDKSMYPPGYEDQGGDGLTFHLTLADVDAKTNKISRIASTWPWVFAHSGRRNMGFEVSTSLSRWLQTLQARLNVTGSPMSVLMTILQLSPINHILNAISFEPGGIRSLAPPGVNSMIQFHFKSLVDNDTEDQSHLLLSKIIEMSQAVSPSFESVKGLHVMHMYTSAESVRLVFNSRYVVDLRLVATDLVHVSDAMAAARLTKGKPSAVAPEPLVTSAMESIPMFGDWIQAVSRGMRLEWDRLEKAMSTVAGQESEGGPEKIRLLQRNMHRLKPDSRQLERMMYRVREINYRQSSLVTPAFIPLPPDSLISSKIQMVPVLRSLMQWLVKSVHVRDQLESAITLVQEIIKQEMVIDESVLVPEVSSATATATATAANTNRLRDPLFCVKEKLVFTKDMPSDSQLREKGEDLSNRQVMIVGFTGAKDSVRCEFLMQAGVNSATSETQQATGSMMWDLFTIPSDLMRVDLDVRIVPMNRPPNGITEAAASWLVGQFQRQTSDVRQRAGVLVRILALPPQLVMDIVDIGTKLEGKAATCAAVDGREHMIRIFAGHHRVVFSMRFCQKEGGWKRVIMEYSLLSGTARVLWVMDINDRTEVDLDQLTNVPSESITRWTGWLETAMKELDNETAFTRDMGKSGKSRWYDIVGRLYRVQAEN